MVRQAQPSDAAVVAELLGELGYPTSTAESAERLRALSGPDHRVLLVDDGAGLIALHRMPLLAEGAALMRITALVVRPDARGRGVARSLLAAAEATAQEWECRLIEVSSGLRPEREPAHRLYRAAGFADASSRSVRYWKAVGAAGES